MAPPVHVTETPLDRASPPQPATKNQGPIVAVDLGTSNILLAAVQQGRPAVLSTPRQRTPPSWIAVGPRGDVVVGIPAENQAASYPELAVFGVKRLTEGSFNSPAIRALRQQQSCPFFEGPGGQVGVRLGDRAFAPRELVAILLADARNRAQEILGQPVYRVAIAVPAGRDQPYRDFMAAAASMAGLHLVAAISEPVAAATIGTPKRGKTVGVFDWGGGGFRFTVLKYPAGTGAPEVLASASDPLLGGIELDPIVLAYLLSKLDDAHPLKSDEGAVKNPRLLAAAERLKQAVSLKEASRAHLPFVYGFGADAVDFDAELTRAELEPILEPFLQRAMAVCEQELEKVGLFPGDLNELILCGEHVAPPLVQARCTEFFHQVPIRKDKPGELVALGTCVAANSAPPPR